MRLRDISFFATSLATAICLVSISCGTMPIAKGAELAKVPIRDGSVELSVLGVARTTQSLKVITSFAFANDGLMRPEYKAFQAKLVMDVVLRNLSARKTEFTSSDLVMKSPRNDSLAMVTEYEKILDYFGRSQFTPNSLSGLFSGDLGSSGGIGIGWGFKIPLRPFERKKITLFILGDLREGDADIRLRSGDGTETKFSITD